MDTSLTSAIASATTAKVLLRENASRREFIVANDSTAILYILYGPGQPSSTNYSLQLPANTSGVATLIDDVYNGRVAGVWASANGYAYVTELVSE